MKAIKRPLTYFFIWMAWAAACLMFAGSMNEIVWSFLFFAISGMINIAAHYHIVFSRDKLIKKKEPELYRKIEENNRASFKGLGITPQETNAALLILFGGTAREYPSIRPQIIECIAGLVFMVIGWALGFSILILIVLL